MGHRTAFFYHPWRHLTECAKRWGDSGDTGDGRAYADAIGEPDEEDPAGAQPGAGTGGAPGGLIVLSGRDDPIAPSDGALSAQEENGEDAILALVCAVAEYSHESISTVLEWSWKLFCAMACRMIRYQHDERIRRAQEDEQREIEADADDVQRRHAQLMGR